MLAPKIQYSYLKTNQTLKIARARLDRTIPRLFKKSLSLLTTRPSIICVSLCSFCVFREIYIPGPLFYKNIEIKKAFQYSLNFQFYWAS